MDALDRVFRKKITELALCANGPGVVLDREGVKGGDRLNIPKNYGSQVLDLYRRYTGCKSDTARLRVVADVQDELRQHKVRKKRDYHPGTLELKMMVTRDRRSDATVSYVYGIDVRTVRKYRAEITERIVSALNDASVRQVADQFGISKSVVGRLRNAA
jgi:hypothetical protein